VFDVSIRALDISGQVSGESYFAWMCLDSQFDSRLCVDTKAKVDMVRGTEVLSK